MSDHDAPQRPREAVRVDRGGWISGPSADTEPVPAGQIEAGDYLLLDDRTRAEVTDIRDGFYRFAAGRELGVAIGWKSGTSSGMLFRRAGDILHRLTRRAVDDRRPV
jgi:hypothetical protein